MKRPFRDALLARLDETGIDLAEVARESGVSYEQLKKLKQGKVRRTNAEDAMAVAAVFGLTLEAFVGDEAIADRLELARLYLQLSPRERQLLQVLEAAPPVAPDDTP